MNNKSYEEFIAKIKIFAFPKVRRYELYKQRFNGKKSLPFGIKQSFFEKIAQAEALRWHTSVATGAHIASNDLKLCKKINEYYLSLNLNYPHNFYVNQFGNIRVKLGSTVTYDRSVSDKELRELIELMNNKKG